MHGHRCRLQHWPLQNKMPIRRKETNLAVKDATKKKKKKLVCSGENRVQSSNRKKTKNKHYGPFISQVSLGCSGLFWSVPYDTP